MYRRLVMDYPEYERHLKRYIRYTYKDDRILFLREMVKRVYYFQAMPVEIELDLIFNLRIKHVRKNEFLFRIDQKIEEIYFIEKGKAEVYSTFEGNKFVID